MQTHILHIGMTLATLYPLYLYTRTHFVRGKNCLRDEYLLEK